MLKNEIKRLAASSFGWRVLCMAARKPGAVVLMYHRIGKGEKIFSNLDQSVFRAQMRWLRDNCHVIAPEDLMRSVHHGRCSKPPVLVTFDDGYRDYHDNAYPVLKDLEIPALVFLATAFIDNGRLIWTDLVHWAVYSTNRSSVTLPWDPDRVLTLAHDHDRDALVSACKTNLKSVPDSERQRLLSKLLKALDVNSDPLVERQMLNWDEVRATMDLTRYGGHTHTHPIMSQLDSSRLETEIVTCRDRISVETGVMPRYFAYPNGRAADFNDEAKTLLKLHGFDMAFTTIEGVNGAATDWMEIRRTPTSARTVADFAWLVVAI